MLQGRRLLVIGTSSERSALDQLNLLRRFQKQIAVPNVNTQQDLAQVLMNSRQFSDSDIGGVLSEIQDVTGSTEIGVGIKTILNCIGSAKQNAAEQKDVFVREITEAIALKGYP